MWFLKELSRAVCGTWLFWGRPRQAGWQASGWQAGFSVIAVVCLPRSRDYSSIVHCVEWLIHLLIHDPYVYFHSFLTLIRLQRTSGLDPFLPGVISISHTLIMVARRGFERSSFRLWVWRAPNTLCVRYDVWVGLDRLEGLNIDGADVATEARSRRAWIAHMYDDMRRIRTIGVATICHERNECMVGVVGVDCL